jgi:hypothetical protein
METRPREHVPCTQTCTQHVLYRACTQTAWGAGSPTEHRPDAVTGRTMHTNIAHTMDSGAENTAPSLRGDTKVLEPAVSF